MCIVSGWPNINVEVMFLMYMEVYASYISVRFSMMQQLVKQWRALMYRDIEYSFRITPQSSSVEYECVQVLSKVGAKQIFFK
jgi:hypothetical protein